MPDPISWSYTGPYLLAALVFGYALGSIPFGVLLTRLAGLGDVRAIGSGNIGATNVLRTGRKDLAALTLLLDALKGTVAVLIAAQYGIDTAVVAGLGAFVGHLFPVWLGFKGGKGMATFAGILVGLSWQVGLIFAVLWIGLAALTRYSSFASLAASLATPFILVWRGEIQLAQLFGLLVALLWARHWGNIIRLMRGQESRIGSRS